MPLGNEEPKDKANDSGWAGPMPEKKPDDSAIKDKIAESVKKQMQKEAEGIEEQDSNVSADLSRIYGADIEALYPSLLKAVAAGDKRVLPALNESAGMSEALRRKASIQTGVDYPDSMSHEMFAAQYARDIEKARQRTEEGKRQKAQLVSTSSGTEPSVTGVHTGEFPDPKFEDPKVTKQKTEKTDSIQLTPENRKTALALIAEDPSTPTAQTLAAMLSVESLLNTPELPDEDYSALVSAFRREGGAAATSNVRVDLNRSPSGTIGFNEDQYRNSFTREYRRLALDEMGKNIYELSAKEIGKLDENAEKKADVLINKIVNSGYGSIAVATDPTRSRERVKSYPQALRPFRQLASPIGVSRTRSQAGVEQQQNRRWADHLDGVLVRTFGTATSLFGAPDDPRWDEDELTPGRQLLSYAQYFGSDPHLDRMEDYSAERDIMVRTGVAGAEMLAEKTGWDVADNEWFQRAFGVLGLGASIVFDPDPITAATAGGLFGVKVLGRGGTMLAGGGAKVATNMAEVITINRGSDIAEEALQRVDKGDNFKDVVADLSMGAPDIAHMLDVERNTAVAKAAMYDNDLDWGAWQVVNRKSIESFKNTAPKKAAEAEAALDELLEIQRRLGDELAEINRVADEKLAKTRASSRSVFVEGIKSTDVRRVDDSRAAEQARILADQRALLKHDEDVAAAVAKARSKLVKIRTKVEQINSDVVSEQLALSKAPEEIMALAMREAGLGAAGVEAAAGARNLTKLERAAAQILGKNWKERIREAERLEEALGTMSMTPEEANKVIAEFLEWTRKGGKTDEPGDMAKRMLDFQSAVAVNGAASAVNHIKTRIMALQVVRKARVKAEALLKKDTDLAARTKKRSSEVRETETIKGERKVELEESAIESRIRKLQKLEAEEQAKIAKAIGDLDKKKSKIEGVKERKEGAAKERFVRSEDKAQERVFSSVEKAHEKMTGVRKTPEEEAKRRYYTEGHDWRGWRWDEGEAKRIEDELREAEEALAAKQIEGLGLDWGDKSGKNRFDKEFKELKEKRNQLAGEAKRLEPSDLLVREYVRWKVAKWADAGKPDPGTFDVMAEEGKIKIRIEKALERAEEAVEKRTDMTPEGRDAEIERLGASANEQWEIVKSEFDAVEDMRLAASDRINAEWGRLRKADLSKQLYARWARTSSETPIRTQPVPSGVRPDRGVLREVKQKTQQATKKAEKESKKLRTTVRKGEARSRFAEQITAIEKDVVRNVAMGFGFAKDVLKGKGAGLDFKKLSDDQRTESDWLELFEQAAGMSVKLGDLKKSLPKDLSLPVNAAAKKEWSDALIEADKIAEKLAELGAKIGDSGELAKKDEWLDALGQTSGAPPNQWSSFASKLEELRKRLDSTKKLSERRFREGALEEAQEAYELASREYKDVSLLKLQRDRVASEVSRLTKQLRNLVPDPSLSKEIAEKRALLKQQLENMVEYSDSQVEKLRDAVKVAGENLGIESRLKKNQDRARQIIRGQGAPSWGRYTPHIMDVRTTAQALLRGRRIMQDQWGLFADPAVSHIMREEVKDEVLQVAKSAAFRMDEVQDDLSAIARDYVHMPSRVSAYERYVSGEGIKGKQTIYQTDLFGEDSPWMDWLGWVTANPERTLKGDKAFDAVVSAFLPPGVSGKSFLPSLRTRVLKKLTKEEQIRRDADVGELTAEEFLESLQGLSRADMEEFFRTVEKSIRSKYGGDAEAEDRAWGLIVQGIMLGHNQMWQAKQLKIAVGPHFTPQQALSMNRLLDVENPLQERAVSFNKQREEIVENITAAVEDAYSGFEAWGIRAFGDRYPGVFRELEGDRQLVREMIRISNGNEAMVSHIPVQLLEALNKSSDKIVKEAAVSPRMKVAGEGLWNAVSKYITLQRGMMVLGGPIPKVGIFPSAYISETGQLHEAAGFMTAAKIQAQALTDYFPLPFEAKARYRESLSKRFGGLPIVGSPIEAVLDPDVDKIMSMSRDTINVMEGDVQAARIFRDFIEAGGRDTVIRDDHLNLMRRRSKSRWLGAAWKWTEDLAMSRNKGFVGYPSNLNRQMWEKIQLMQRLRTYVGIRKQGGSAREAKQVMLEAHYDWKYSGNPLEMRYLNFLIPFYAVHRNSHRQAVRGYLDAMTLKTPKSMLGMLGGPVRLGGKMGRRMQQIRAAKALPALWQWEDPEAILSESEQRDLALAHNPPDWSDAKVHLGMTKRHEDVVKAGKERSGRELTHDLITYPPLTSLDTTSFHALMVQGLLGGAGFLEYDLSSDWADQAVDQVCDYLAPYAKELVKKGLDSLGEPAVVVNAEEAATLDAMGVNTWTQDGRAHTSSWGKALLPLIPGMTTTFIPLYKDVFNDEWTRGWEYGVQRMIRGQTRLGDPIAVNPETVVDYRHYKQRQAAQAELKKLQPEE